MYYIKYFGILLISCWVICLPNSLLFAQIKTIHIPDPSFENAQVNTNTFYVWQVCNSYALGDMDGTLHLNGDFPHVFYPTNGNRYIWMGTLSTNLFSGSIGIKLDSPTIKGKQHWFYIDATTCFAGNDSNVDSIVAGKVAVYLGDSLCGMQQQIWLSPRLDRVWHRYKVTFVPDSNYQYIRLMANCPVNNCGSHVFIDNLSNITVNLATGVETLKAEDVKVYPNPANQSIVISQQSLVKTIEVYDVIGSKFENLKMSRFENEIQIQLNDLASGIYFIKTTDVKGNMSNAKFVKE